jgi:hypothetical protein
VCVVKYIRARLPSQARRAGLASQTRTCMGTFSENRDRVGNVTVSHSGGSGCEIQPQTS